MDFTMESVPPAPPTPVHEPYKMEVDSMNPPPVSENAVHASEVEEPVSDHPSPKTDNCAAEPQLNKGHNAEPEPPDLEAKPRVDLVEAQGALAAMALTSVAVGEYLVVLRSQFDVFVAGEPYPALMVLYNLTSGKVLTRIWNQGWVENLYSSDL